MAKEVSQSVVNALRLLECFADSEELGITELAETLDLGKAVVARLVGSLEEFGYLRQNSRTKKYRLGVKFMSWGSLVGERNEIVQLMERYLRELSEQFQSTAHLAVWEDDASLILSKFTKGPVVYMSSRVGNTLSAHASATGKCLLAYQGDEIVSRFLDTHPLTRHTENTLIGREELLKELEQIRTRGYALDREESHIGLYCVAAPLFDIRNKVVAAISVSGQVHNISYRQEEILAWLRSVAKEVQRLL